MNFKRLLNTKVGITFISIMLGLGLAVLFRSACNGKDCLNFKGPKFSDIDGKVYQFGDSCYKYNTVSGICDPNKKALDFSNVENFTDSPTNAPVTNAPEKVVYVTSAPNAEDYIKKYLNKMWVIITKYIYLMIR
jgi:hypothetical protein